MTLKNYIILITLYTIFGLISIFFEIRELSNKKRIEIMDFFRFFYLFFYCIVPICYITAIKTGSYLELRAYEWMETNSLIFKYIIFIIHVTIYIGINFFYNLLNKNRKIEKKEKNEIDINKSYFYISNLIIMTIGWIALVIYTRAYGSIFGIFDYAPLIRDNIFIIENKFTFMQPITMFLIISSLNYVVLLKNMNNKSTKYKSATIILALISFFGLFVVLESIDSRTKILSLMLMIAFLLFSKKIFNINKKTIIILIAFVIVFMVLMANADNITNLFRKNGTENLNISTVNILDFINSNFGFVYVNNLNILDRIINQKNLQIRIGENIKGITVSLLPRSIKEKVYTNMHVYNTSFSEKERGVIPSDLMTSSIYSMGYLGPIIFSVWIAIILYLLNMIFERYKQLNDFYILLKGYIGFDICMSLVSFYDISSIIFSCFELIAGIIIIIIFKVIAMKAPKLNKCIERIYRIFS